MTPQQIEALKLALECAERCEAIDGMYSWSATITAIKESLAENAMRKVQRLGQEIEQEPVAWATKEDFHRELERRLKHIREEMKIKSVTMRCKDYDIALPIIDTDFGRVLVGQVSTPPQRTEPVVDYIAARDMLDEQPVPPRTWIGLEGAEAGWFCHTDFLNARKYTKKQREYICNQLLSEAQSWDIDQYIRMMHDSTKRPFIGLTDEDMYVVSEEESCSFIAGAKWSEDILKGKNA